VASHGSLVSAHMVDFGTRVGVGATERSYGLDQNACLAGEIDPGVQGWRERTERSTTGSGETAETTGGTCLLDPTWCYFRKTAVRRHIPQMSRRSIQGISGSGPWLIKWRLVAFQSTSSSNAHLSRASPSRSVRLQRPASSRSCCPSTRPSKPRTLHSAIYRVHSGKPERKEQREVRHINPIQGVPRPLIAVALYGCVGKAQTLLVATRGSLHHKCWQDLVEQPVWQHRPATHSRESPIRSVHCLSANGMAGIG
jgi:hypothetical protein